jgi:hypothetical protein
MKRASSPAKRTLNLMLLTPDRRTIVCCFRSGALQKRASFFGGGLDCGTFATRLFLWARAGRSPDHLRVRRNGKNQYPMQRPSPVGRGRVIGMANASVGFPPRVGAPRFASSRVAICTANRTRRAAPIFARNFAREGSLAHRPGAHSAAHPGAPIFALQGDDLGAGESGAQQSIIPDAHSEREERG